MKTLIPEEAVVNKRQDEPWKKRERDRALDLYFRGVHPTRIATKLQRNPKAVTRLIEEYQYNERDKALRYEPKRRVSREGMRITENERFFLKAHGQRQIPLAITARILGRQPGELLATAIVESRSSVKEDRNTLKAIAPTLDQLLAHRYLFHCTGHPIISDLEYDSVKAEEIEYGCGKALLSERASKTVVDYPHHIRSLAMYMKWKHDERRGKWNWNQYPTGWKFEPHATNPAKKR